MATPKKDLTGRRFGRLVAVEDTGERKSGHVVWLCKCDCGSVKNIRSGHLLRGTTLSCGCLRIENAKKIGSGLVGADYVEGTILNHLNSKSLSNNTSGTKGVTWNKRAKKWTAGLMLKKKYYHLGYFSTKQDAINARKEAEEKYFRPMLEKYGRE